MNKCYWCEQPFTFGDITSNFLRKAENGKQCIDYAHQKCQIFVYKCREQGDIIETPAKFKEMQEKYANEN